MTPADLPDAWRERADLLAGHGAVEAAETCRKLASELDAALRAAEDETLTLAEAARESGYSERRLRELLTTGDVPQAGRTGRPRIRRGDLPRKARARTAGSYDAAADAAALMRRSR